MRGAHKYRPDGWVIIQVSDDLFKVFGSWGGGYLDGDTWRLNSGITSFNVEGDKVVFYGSSGSAYECSLGTEGMLTGYNSAVLRTNPLLKPVSFEKFQKLFSKNK